MDDKNVAIPDQMFGSVAKNYKDFRPRYPPQLFSFLSSLTAQHDLAWDVGTGNGQAAVQVSEYYKRVIATDTSDQQLHHAERRPNITYALTPPSITDQLLHSIVGPDSSVDLVTVATAVHWFDFDKFYPQVKRVLKKPGGVIAVWTYTKPTVDPAVDAVLERFFERVLPFSHSSGKWAIEGYESLPFPFADVETIKMQIEEQRTLDEFFMLFSTSFAILGNEGLLSEVRGEFEAAWGAPANVPRTLKFPLLGKIGKL